MRLNRYLAQCGLGSRRSCEDLITANRVRINGQPGMLSSQVGEQDRVEVDGKRLQAPTAAPQVWMLHKPVGVVCTASDPEGRPTVLSLARSCGIKTRLFSVGRLDVGTTGLLLLTDHGDLCHRLTHPSWEIGKEYIARVAQPLSPDELQKLQNGIELEEGRTARCEVEQSLLARGALVKLVLHEGRNRQVRRMLEAVGHAVLRLHRVRVGPLLLGNLPEGSMRRLNVQELEKLEKTLELQSPDKSRPGSPGA